MSKDKPVSIGLLGLGTVGSGVLNVLSDNAAEIERRTGRSIRITHVCARDANKKRAVVLDGMRFSTDPMEVVNNKSIDIVIELIGGHQPAFDLTMQAMQNGKHIVTANKALIALSGNQLFDIAGKNQVMLTYEGAVAGGIPIVKVLREGLAANRINRVVGIVNGTTNFILTEVSDKQRSFSDALAEAQRLGYAEADPTFDVDGIDAAHKLTIIASVSFGIPLQYDRVYVESVAGVDMQDVAYAKELGYRIKHLAIAKRVGDSIELRVHPTLIPLGSLLADVNGVMNAVLVDGNAVGSTLYYGAGAGSQETASAVVADLIDVVRAMSFPAPNRVPDVGFQSDALIDIPVLDSGEVISAYYLRLQVKDRPGVLAAITKVLNELNISIEAVLQKETANDDTPVPLILLIHPVKAKDICAAIDQIEQFDTVIGKIVRYHLESL